MLHPKDISKPKPIEDFLAAEVRSNIAAARILPRFELVEEGGQRRLVYHLAEGTLTDKIPTRVAPRAEPTHAPWGLDKIEFTLRDDAVAIPLDEMLTDNIVGLNIEQTAIRIATSKLGVTIDSVFAAFLKDDSNITGGKKASAGWKTTPASAQKDVADGKIAVHKKTSTPPTTLICNPEAYHYLPDWLSIKGGAASGAAIVASELAVDSLDMIDGASAGEFLYTEDAVLATTDPSPDADGMVPAFAGLFVDSQLNFKIRRYVHSRTNVPTIEVRVSWAIVSLSPNAAYRLADVNS